MPSIIFPTRSTSSHCLFLRSFTEMVSPLAGTRGISWNDPIPTSDYFISRTVRSISFGRRFPDPSTVHRSSYQTACFQDVVFLRSKQISWTSWIRCSNSKGISKFFEDFGLRVILNNCPKIFFINKNVAAFTPHAFWGCRWNHFTALQTLVKNIFISWEASFLCDIVIGTLKKNLPHSFRICPTFSRQAFQKFSLRILNWSSSSPFK